MPLGWYLAQGLIPLLPSDSDDEEGPCELPNGKLVCGPHGLVVCYKCCSDYSYMDDVSDDDLGGNVAHYGDEDEVEEDDDVLDPITEAKYWELSPESRAEIDSRWGPPRTSRPQANTVSGHGTSSTRSAGSINTASSLPITLPAIEDAMGPGKQRGTGCMFPTTFSPPSSLIKPTELFPGRSTYGRLTRYVHRTDIKKCLILTDGACLDNGKANPRAGWAFVPGPGDPGKPPKTIACRLENAGPFGDPGIQSSNRAELRAVIAALRFRNWAGEGFSTVVIATDSEYVTTGSTQWAKTWLQNSWRTANKAEVKNKDLWEMLLGEVERHHGRGLSIQFWRISRAWNTVADEAAKKAATEDAIEQWADMFGTSF